MSYDRRERIRQLLEKQGSVTIKELEQEFPNISSMTIRRDLEYLESVGEAIRIRGGARSIKHADGGHEAAYSLRAAENLEAKMRVAKIASRFIEPGRSCFLDSGSTIMALARILPDLNLSILTSAPNVAMEVVKRYNPTVNLIGGVLSRENLSVSGIQAAEFIRNFNIDVAFVVPSAFSIENGFSCGNYSECDLKRAILKKARRSILLIDHSKFDKNLPFTFARLPEVQVIVTDRRPPEPFLEAIEREKIALYWE